MKEWITNSISYHGRKTLRAKLRARIQTPGAVHPLNNYLTPDRYIHYACFILLAQYFPRPQPQRWKLVTVTVVFLLRALLRSRVTPRDHLRQPLSPLNTVFSLPSPLCFSSLLLSFNLTLLSIKQYKSLALFRDLTLLELMTPLA